MRGQAEGKVAVGRLQRIPEAPEPEEVSGARTTVDVYSLGMLYATIMDNTPPIKQLMMIRLRLLHKSSISPTISISLFPFLFSLITLSFI